MRTMPSCSAFFRRREIVACDQQLAAGADAETARLCSEGRRLLFSIARQFGITLAAAAVTYAVGHLLGVVIAG